MMKRIPSSPTRYGELRLYVLPRVCEPHDHWHRFTDPEITFEDVSHPEGNADTPRSRCLVVSVDRVTVNSLDSASYHGVGPSGHRR